MTIIEDIKKKKKELGAIERNRKKEIRACFWTRPWGHWWIKTKYESYAYKKMICKACGKTKFKYKNSFNIL